MIDKVPALTDPPEGYADWLTDLKSRIHAAQQRAALVVNTGLLRLYWQIGRDIIDRQAEQGWGSKVVARLAHDLREAFPDLGGFSRGAIACGLDRSQVTSSSPCTWTHRPSATRCGNSAQSTITGVTQVLMRLLANTRSCVCRARLRR